MLSDEKERGVQAVSIATSAGGQDVADEMSREQLLRHELLRLTDRALGAEQTAKRSPTGLLAETREKLAESRAGLGRRDQTLAEAAAKIRRLEAEVAELRNDLARSQRAHQRAQRQADTVLASRYYRVGRQVVRPAERLEQRVKTWRAR